MAFRRPGADKGGLVAQLCVRERQSERNKEQEGQQGLQTAEGDKFGPDRERERVGVTMVVVGRKKGGINIPVLIFFLMLNLKRGPSTNIARLMKDKLTLPW